MILEKIEYDFGIILLWNNIKRHFFEIFDILKNRLFNRYVTDF